LTNDPFSFKISFNKANFKAFNEIIPHQLQIILNSEGYLMQETSSRSITNRTPLATLHTTVGIILLLLALQFLIGIVVNLYVQIPAIHPGTGSTNYFAGIVQGVVWALGHGTWSLVIHTAAGLLLVLASFLLIGLAIASRQRVWIILSLVGWVGVVAAGFNGASFLNYGHDFSSLLMSSGFLLAAISYTIGFSLRHRDI
jgi:hypothetical protein